MFNKKSILITGGTGSFGKRFVKRILQNFSPNRIIIFSRDELKQYEMQKIYPTEKYPCMRYFIGDVRDYDRLLMALRGVDFVIHAAALKHVNVAEYNPFEFIKTNINGAENVIQACVERRVEKVVALSTDKACNPINLYGATKLCSDKSFVAGNAYSGSEGTRFSVVRYGNVIGSRGSVIPFFLQKIESGIIPITDDRMTRFLITLDQGVDLVFKAFNNAKGGEIFIPKIPSIKITDLASTIAPSCKQEVIGIRPGEKLHEAMIGPDDALNTVDMGEYFVILPTISYGDERLSYYKTNGKPVENGFSYTSENNSEWMTSKELLSLLEQFEHRGSELVYRD
ncbi:MAG: UDP-N-acetylglucosamine 4,6-dehydratase (inverting) [Bdellovibrionota bacterium]